MKKHVAAILVALALMSSAANVGSAHQNHWVGIPQFYGGGSLVFDSYSSGRLYVDHYSGPYCVYIQYRGAHRWAVDNSTWHRGTNDSCGPAVINSFSFSDYYSGVRVRVCQNVPNQPDPCGSNITHYTW